jgi:pheromone shutdown-related protein TraB
MTLLSDTTAMPRVAQPLRETEVGDTRLTLLGTAHVSRASAEEVERLLRTGVYDAVAVELDPGRHAALTDPERWAKTDLFAVLREGKAAMMAANLALSAFQQRIAEQSGIEPGEEMRRALRVASELNLPVLLIDREIGVTLRRVYRSVGFWKRLTLLAGLMGSVVSREEVTPEEIEKLKEGDVLEATFAEFSDKEGSLYTPLIGERDRYMAARLREETGTSDYRRVLVVIGAGHLKGLYERLEQPPETPPADELRALTALPKGVPWGQIISWLLIAFFVLGFALAFVRSPEIGWQLLGQWLLLNGGLAALGAAVALAHPLTVLATFLGAPFATLSPTLGVGLIAAGLELWLRKPQMGDFAALRQDITETRGWWRNKVARILLIFFLTSIGGAIGNYLTLPRLFGQLF